MDDRSLDLIAQLAYPADVRGAVEPEVVDHVANGVLSGRMFANPPGDYLAAIRDALREVGPIARWEQNEQHLRRYLEQLAERLEISQPWPEPAYRALPLDAHRDLLSAPVVVRLTEPESRVTTRLNQLFDPVDQHTVGLVLELAGGTRVALTAPATPSPEPVAVHAVGVDATDLARLLSRTTRLASQPG